MSARTWAFGSGVVLLALGVAVPGGAPGAAADPIRGLIGPLVLPTMWAGLERAERDGEIGEAIARARTLLEFMPGWTDGQIYFASQLALDLSRRAATPRAAGDRLAAALAWLDEARSGADPAAAAEILTAQAFLVELRCRDDEKIADEIRARFGRDPAEIADGYLAAACDLHPSDAMESRRAYRGNVMILAALERDDLLRAREVATVTMEMLGRLADRDPAAEYHTALAAFVALLDGDSGPSTRLRGRNAYLDELLAGLDRR